ncbi:MAG TPA: phosphoenolpyruvate--protein phosphotransferase [Nocardioidaceae bacterium]|nr:phosphoenolpyruvate--protein phosphotransferase [Nocardioidaceae bacterium]HSE72759.1 phosphoenolpyruvate--protein phosphotransferase [Nocardioidaceae bacterium]
MTTSPSAARQHATLRGTPVVPGVVLAPVVVATAKISQRAIDSFDGQSLNEEEAIARYDEAVAVVADRLAARAAKATGSAAEVLSATAGLARDKGLRSAVVKRLKSGDALLGALAAGVDQFAGLFTQMGGLMAERVTDLRDIEKRVTAEIVGEPEPGVPTPEEPSVLVAEDLAPADTAGLDAAKVVALVTEKGGPTSHTAIIARQLAIPCVVAVHGVLETVKPGTTVLVDGSTGVLEVSPDETEARERVAAAEATRRALETWNGPARTSDGTRVKVLANVADGASARAAAQGPVEGVGLFRTELCFLNRKDEPSVDEQASVYAEVLDAFGAERTVVIRTLDAGSDKPIAFATLEGEENPALGVRGLRLSFGNPGLLERQLAAIASAAQRTATEPWVMAPMVATVHEAREFAAQVHDHGLRAGVMVEIPSAALQAHKMLEHVDFLSIGTNDLTQYTMAADRMASDLAHLTDAWQPAVLALIAITAEAGKQAGKPVGVCGEAAADPTLATALVGMGVTSLSMAAAAVRPVGAQLAQVSMDMCEHAAEAALAQVDPMAARDAVRAVLSR